MAQYPVSDQQGVIDGLNYVLSGPSNLGDTFKGYSSSVYTPISEETFNIGTGQREVVTPIDTNGSVFYLTDCITTLNATSKTQEVMLTGQLNMRVTYTNVGTGGLQYGVFLNRYRAYPKEQTVDYPYYFEKTVASHIYNYPLETTDGAIYNFSGAAGTKIAYTMPATGAVGPAVDVTLSGIGAATGSGADAVLQIQIAYGTAGTYDLVNTKVNIISPGDAWTAGSTIVIPGDQLGGATPANDLTLTVGSVTVGSSLEPINTETVFTGIRDIPAVNADPTLPAELGYFLYAIEVTWLGLAGGVTIDSANMSVRSISAQTVRQ